MPIVAVVALQFLAVWPLLHGGPDDSYSNLIFPLPGRDQTLNPNHLS